MISNDPHQVRRRRLQRCYTNNEREGWREGESGGERVSGHLVGKLSASFKKKKKEMRTRGIILD